MSRFLTLLLSFLVPAVVFAQDGPAAYLSMFDEGRGPSYADGVYHLLDASHSFEQSNAIAFDIEGKGQYEKIILTCDFRVPEGGDGGAFIFLNTEEYGMRGPAPYIKNWVEPNLIKTFAVGIDVHNPTSAESFDKWGNYQEGLPEREISLHWDQNEIVKRLSPVEFRGKFTKLEIIVQHVIGGAEVTVRITGEPVFDRFFIAGMLPYESRLAIGAGTREDEATEFDVREISFSKSSLTEPVHHTKHIKVFNHVKTDNSTRSHLKEVLLPPRNFAYGRIILTLEIHDAGPDWDEWDRNGYLYIVFSDGVKYDIAPFITSFRKPFLRQVDVTHFRPWLAGRVKFEIATESGSKENFGYMVSASLDFYQGVQEFEPYQVVPLWVGTAKYKSNDNHFSDFFNLQTVDIDASAQRAQLFITTTGHSKIGEFTPARRTVIFAPVKGSAETVELRFENILWKNDNYLNPTRPQSGTWEASRAGWAPGDMVQPWRIDLTPYIIPGKTAELRYEPAPYDFSYLPAAEQPTQEEINQAVHLVRAYLVLYRTPKDIMPVPPLLVLEVMEASNAEKAGIQPGDYIMSYDGRRPDSIEEIRKAISSAEKEDKKKITVVIYRSTKIIKMELDSGRMGVMLEEQ